MTTEYEFYQAVKKVCDAEAIDDCGRWFVEMYCAENGADCEDVWGTALRTLEMVIDQPEGLAKVAANQSPEEPWEYAA